MNHTDGAHGGLWNDIQVQLGPWRIFKLFLNQEISFRWGYYVAGLFDYTCDTLISLWLGFCNSSIQKSIYPLTTYTACDFAPNRAN